MDSCTLEPLKSLVTMNHALIDDHLPVEIPSFIFQICCLGDNSPSAERNMNPLILSAVSRYWRNVAFSTPNLWTSIALEILHDRETPLLLAQEWLDRSGMLPLYISLYVDEDINWKAPLSLQKISDFIQMLNVYALRWRELELTVPAELLDVFRCNDHSETPILSALSLTTFHTDHQRATNFDLGVLPSPSKLHMTSTNLAWINLDFRNLTEFACDAVTESEILQIFEGCPRIETVKIVWFVSGDEDDDDDDGTASLRMHAPQSPIVVQHLRKFHLERHAPHSPRTWNLWMMPSLQSLAVCFDYDLGRQPYLPSFLQQPTFVNLTTLHISGDKDNYRHIYNLLCRLNNLENFKADGITLPREFFQKMHDTAHLVEVHDNDTQLFLPQLRTFKYHNRKVESQWSCLPLLLSPLTLGSGRRRPLKEVILVNAAMGSNDIDKETLQYIADAQEQGIVVNVSDILGHDLIAISQRVHRELNQEGRKS